MKIISAVVCVFLVTVLTAIAAEQPGDAPAGREVIRTSLGAEIPEQPELEPHWGGWVKSNWPHWRQNYWIDRGPWPGANRGYIYRKEQPKTEVVELAPEPPEGLTPITPEGKPIEPLVAEPAPPTTRTTPQTYTVKKGDCLWFIAGKVYGDPLKWPKIFRANRARIKNPDRIYPGQVLDIPPLN